MRTVNFLKVGVLVFLVITLKTLEFLQVFGDTTWHLLDQNLVILISHGMTLLLETTVNCWLTWVTLLTD